MFICNERKKKVKRKKEKKKERKKERKKTVINSHFSNFGKFSLNFFVVFYSF